MPMPLTIAIFFTTKTCNFRQQMFSTV